MPSRYSGTVSTTPTVTVRLDVSVALAYTFVAPSVLLNWLLGLVPLTVIVPLPVAAAGAAWPRPAVKRHPSQWSYDALSQHEFLALSNRVNNSVYLAARSFASGTAWKTADLTRLWPC